MSLRVYNTLTRQKEPFQTVHPGKVGIYLCGPTVYKTPHIGHMVGPVIFDAIKRYLRAQRLSGHLDRQHHRCRRQAHREGQRATRPRCRSWPRSTRPSTSRCLKSLGRRSDRPLPQGHRAHRRDHRHHAAADRQGLRLRRRRRRLVRRHQGRRLRQALQPQASRSRKPARARPKAPASATRPTSPSGKPPSPASRRGIRPWGKGRPGWHIECSAMSMKYLGETLRHPRRRAGSAVPASRERAGPVRKLHRQALRQLLDAQRPDPHQDQGRQRRVERREDERLHRQRRLGAASWSTSTGRTWSATSCSRTHYRRPIEFTDEVIANCQKALSRLRAALRTCRAPRRHAQCTCPARATSPRRSPGVSAEVHST